MTTEQDDKPAEIRAKKAKKKLSPAHPSNAATVSYSPTSLAWKDDAGKVRLDLLPFCALEDVARVLEYGASKYGTNTWRRVGRARYVAAALRHLHAHAAGRSVDDESGLSHLAHAATSLLFALELPK